MRINKPWYQVYMHAEPTDGGAPADPAPQDPAPQDPAPTDTQPANPVDTQPTEQPPVSFLQSLPQDWRTELVSAAFQDEEGKKRAQSMLDRVPDMRTLAKNYVEAQEKIRKGEISNGLPENPTEEQIAAYREAHGIPKSPEDYKIEPGNGLTMGEDDQRIMQQVAAVAHKHNIPESALNDMTSAMLQAREAEYEAIQNQDGLDTQQAERQLKEVWGADHTRNLNAVLGMVRTLPDSVREDFENARLANGRALFNSPEFMTWLADMAYKANPAATVVPGSNNPVQSINDEIKALEKRMGTPEWYKDEDAQKRYQDLIDARERMNAQG